MLPSRQLVVFRLVLQLVFLDLGQGYSVLCLWFVRLVVRNRIVVVVNYGVVYQCYHYY